MLLLEKLVLGSVSDYTFILSTLLLHSDPLVVKFFEYFKSGM